MFLFFIIQTKSFLSTTTTLSSHQKKKQYKRAQDFYGHSVSLDGDLALVGAYGTDNNGESSGSV
jgi:hypothetical protein